MFSCGNFIKTQRIPSDQTSTDSFSNLRVTLAYAVADQLELPINNEDITATSNSKKYYLSCLDEGNENKNNFYGKIFFYLFV